MNLKTESELAARRGGYARPTMPRARQLVVTDPKAAALLLHESERAYLSYFFDEPLSVAAVAKRLNAPVPKVLYRVSKLERHGLLEVAREERRAGRPIKHYRTTAERFVVPYAHSGAADAQEFLGLIEGTLRTAFYESFLPDDQAQGTGIEVSRSNPEGQANLAFVVASEDGWYSPGASRSPTDVIGIDLLALPPERAQDLKRDLLALVARYRAFEEADEPLFLLRTGLVRLGREHQMELAEAGDG